MTKAESPFNTADSLYHAQQYFRSAIEYERILFEQEDAGIQRRALLQKALSLKHQQRYTDAIHELNRISIRDPQDTLLAHKSYQLAACYYLNKNYQQCIEGIVMVQTALMNHPILTDLLILKILSHNHLFQHEQARQTLIELSKHSGNGTLYQQIAHDLYESDKPKKYKNPEKAHNLSMIIPGTGHLYSGAIGEGAISFILNASALSFGAWHVYSGYYFTGYVVGVTTLERFHTGGKKRAENLAIWKNTENANQLNLQIISYLNKEH